VRTSVHILAVNNRRQRYGGRFLLTLLWWSAAFILAGCAISSDGETMLVAFPLRKDVRIALNLTEQPPRADIFSASGIGGAGFLFAGGSAPADFTLRLRLHGLEALTLACDGCEVLVSARNRRDPSIGEMLACEGDATATPLAPDDAGWADVRIVHGEQAGAYAGLPVRFDIRMPAAFAARGCSSLYVEWVDFYR